MTTALLWCALVLMAYSVFTLIWALRQPAFDEEKPDCTLSNFDKNRLIKLFVLVNMVLIIAPLSVYLHGFAGLLWLAVMLGVLVLGGIFLSYFSVTADSHLENWFRIAKKMVVLTGAVGFLGWQMGVITQFIEALSSEPLGTSWLKFSVTLFMLLVAIFARQHVLHHFSAVKLVFIYLILSMVSFIVYAYIGGLENFSNHLERYYSSGLSTQYPAETSIGMSILLALAGGVFALALLSELDGCVDRQFLDVSMPLTRKKKFVRVISMFFMLGLTLSFIVLLGFGAHFTGADMQYSMRFNQYITVLFDPLTSESEPIHLMALFIQSLAMVVPPLVGLIAALAIIVMVTTGQIVLWCAARVLGEAIIVLLYKSIEFTEGEVAIVKTTWQRRSYTVILIAALLFSGFVN